MRIMYKSMQTPVKIFCGFLYKDRKIYEETKLLLEDKFGPVDCESDTVPFDFTDYYEKEMGTNLIRNFISFENLSLPENSWEWKIFTNETEKKFSETFDPIRRKINIDPGYLNLSRLVLFSTKDYYHRIYLAKGIYAETTLYWREHAFKTFPWTYPDYKTDFAFGFFTKVRQRYKIALQSKME